MSGLTCLCAEVKLWGRLFDIPFFLTVTVRGEEVKRIEKYFSIRRRSGGGDCGPLRRVKDTIYSVDFKHEKDQQAVLQRHEHVVELADGPLEFTVRRSLDPCASSPSTPPTTSQEMTTAVQNPQSIPASTSPTSGILQLGKAKLHLLWKEIENNLGRDFPGVKITQGEAGQLVLEGSAEELVKAGDLISEMEKLVFERTVSDISPHVLAFLKKAYSGPGELSDFLQVGDKVEVELGDTELHFFTLTIDNFDEIENALQGVIKDVIIKIPDSSVESSELREMLKSVTDEMNQGQYRVQVVFGSHSIVRLVGHRKEVEELSETVSTFILDHQSNTACQNLASDAKLSKGSKIVASYSLCDELQVQVCHGDISELEADALVNAANEDLDHCGGVAAALSKAGGPEIQNESNTLVKHTGKISAGDVVVTTGGNLKCKKLLHAVGPIHGKVGSSERILLEKVVHSALNLAEMMDFKSIAMPCISSGAFGVPVDVCSEAIVTAVKGFGSYGGRSLSRIILIDNRGDVIRALQGACDRLFHGISKGNNAPFESTTDAAVRVTARTPGNGVHVEITQGTIEMQQVDALVSPMVGHGPLSTRVGNTLLETVGPQLIAEFEKAAREETLPGDTVLIDSLTGLPANAVFFLNLSPWDGDLKGTAVQVLRQGITTILSLCENRGFGSVALPVVGAGIALGFPDVVVARVLLEQVHAFEQSRTSRSPFLVRIIIFPSDTETNEIFKCVQEDFQLEGFTKKVHHPHQVSPTKRIILLGKTGSGKSNLANTIFGEKLFKTNHSPNSGTSECQAETKSINGRSITLIDTPGFFDAERPEEQMKPEIVRSITECAPGPHAFVIVLKVEKFTEHEQAVINKISQYLTEDALKYAVIVFTHGNQLPKGMKIEEFVSQNKNLSALVKKCSGRCHVVDNKYWKSRQQNEYRSNVFQVEELLKTIDKMVIENNGDYYTNEMFQEVEKEIQKEEETIKQSSGNMSVEEIRQQAKSRVSQKFLNQLVGTTTGALVGAFFGVAVMVGLAITALRNAALLKQLKSMPAVGAVTAAGGTEILGLVAGAATAGLAATGGVVGGVIGHDASEGAETALEAAELAANAVINKGKAALKDKLKF